MRSEIKLTIVDGDTGDDIELPSKLCVCWRCRGTGVHDHPAFVNGLSKEDFDEDPDFREDYFSGQYDVPCSECKGLRVLAEPDLEKFTPEQAALWKDRCAYQSELAAEQRMRDRGIEF